MKKNWLREFLEFALDRDVGEEIERQQARLAADARSAEAHYKLAVLYYSQRRTPEAISEYETAIACDPSFAPAYRKLGELYIAGGDYERAGKYALLAAGLGDRHLLDMFERYPNMRVFIGEPAE
jgi:tetratricopeptide (TPR) repeat protein